MQPAQPNEKVDPFLDPFAMPSAGRSQGPPAAAAAAPVDPFAALAVSPPAANPSLAAPAPVASASGNDFLHDFFASNSPKKAAGGEGGGGEASSSDSDSSDSGSESGSDSDSEAEEFAKKSGRAQTKSAFFPSLFHPCAPLPRLFQPT